MDMLRNMLGNNEFSFLQLDESKHLPSPLCEKLEISKDLSTFLRPVALPPYMSAWELDVTNGSVPDYSLELVGGKSFFFYLGFTDRECCLFGFNVAFNIFSVISR